MSRSLAIEAALAIVSLLDQAYGDNSVAKGEALNVVQALLNIAPDPAPEPQSCGTGAMSDQRGRNDY